MRHCRAMVGRLAVLAMAGFAAVGAWAKGIDDFTLTKLVPADVYLAVHMRSHEGQAFVQKQYARVWEEIEKARLDRDMKRLFKALAEQGGTTPEDFESQWTQMSDLLNSVEWGALCKKEFAFAMKQGFPTPEFLFLMAPADGAIDKQFEGLSGLLKTMAGMAPDEMSLASDDAGGMTVHRLTLTGAPFPMGLTLARNKNTVLVGWGTGLVEQTLAMMRGESGTTLSSTDRFKAALKSLPAPVDSLVFFDASLMMKQLQGMFDQISGMIPEEEVAEGQTPGPNPMKVLPGKIIEALNLVDYTAAVTSTEGMKTTEQSVARLLEDAKDKPMYKAFFGTGTLDDPLKYVPATASDMSVGSGIDMLALYNGVLDFIKTNVPDGPQMLAQWDAMQAEMGYNVGDDFLSWLQGGMVSFSVPGATQFGPGEFVYMLKVKDESKAREMVGKLMSLIEPMLSQQNGAVSDAEIEGAEGFRSVLHPMLGMAGMKSPTIGVKDGWLMLGSSPEILRVSLEVAAGKAPNFSKNERFKKEGIEVGKNVVRLSFTDLSKLGDQLAQAMSMAQMGIMMGAQELMRNPAGQALIGILPKITRVVRKLDFFQSSSSQTTFDGSELKSTSIVTYREPPAPETQPASEPPAAGEETPKAETE